MPTHILARSLRKSSTCSSRLRDPYIVEATTPPPCTRRWPRSPNAASSKSATSIQGPHHPITEHDNPLAPLAHDHLRTPRLDGQGVDGHQSKAPGAPTRSHRRSQDPPRRTGGPRSLDAKLQARRALRRIRCPHPRTPALPPTGPSASAPTPRQRGALMNLSPA